MHGIRGITDVCEEMKACGECRRKNERKKGEEGAGVGVDNTSIFM